MTSFLQAFSRQSLSELAFAGPLCRQPAAPRATAQDRDAAEYQVVASVTVALFVASAGAALFALAHAF